MMQKVDDMQLEHMLPQFLEAFHVSTATASMTTTGSAPLKIMDLGCGTGRNTLKLLKYNWNSGRDVRIIGADASEGMLSIAREKIEQVLAKTSRRNVEWDLLQWDFVSSSQHSGQEMNEEPVMHPSIVGDERGDGNFDAVISTLVLEHIPSLRLFFKAVRKTLRHGGMALVTNMHEEMGRKGGAAGFQIKDKDGNVTEKVRGTSYLYAVQDVLNVAEEEGFEVCSIGKNGEDRVREVTVEENILGMIGERGRKWLGTTVWFGFVVKTK